MIDQLSKNITTVFEENSTSFLRCPECLINIPFISFTNTQEEEDIIYLNCQCFNQSKEININQLLKIQRNTVQCNTKCIRHISIGSKYCADCSEWLCKECVNFHLKSSLNHCLLDQELIINCVIHKEPFSYYCVQCNRNICRICQSKHYNHKLIKLTTVNVELFKEYYDNKMKAKKKERENLITDLNKQIDDLAIQIKKLKLLRKEHEIQQNKTDKLNDFMLCLYRTASKFKHHPCYQLISLFQTIKSREGLEYEETLFTSLNISTKQKIKYKSTTLKGHSHKVLQIIELQSGQLASCSFDEYIKIWNPLTSKCNATLIGHTDIVLNLKELNNEQLASHSFDSTIKLWNTKKYICNATFLANNNFTWWLELYDNQLAVYNMQNITIWNTMTYQCMTILDNHHKDIQMMQLKNGQLITFCEEDDLLNFLNPITFKCHASIEVHAVRYFSLIELADGQLASRDNDFSIILWNSLTYKCRAMLKGHNKRIHQIKQFKDGQLASISEDNTIRIWNLLTCKCNGVLALDGAIEGSKWHGSINELNNGQLLSVFYSTLQFWNMSTYTCNATLNIASDNIWTKLLNDGNLVLVSRTDSRIRLWNTLTYKYDAIIEGFNGYFINILQLKDGQLAFPFNNEIKLWQL